MADIPVINIQKKANHFFNSVCLNKRGTLFSSFFNLKESFLNLKDILNVLIPRV